MRISDWSSDVCSSDLAAKAAVQEANVGTIMCSYPRINGTYACENSFLLRDVLRDDWGFRGYVLADYLAAHNAAASFNGGLDFEPWPPLAYRPFELNAVPAATPDSAAKPDDHARNQLRHREHRKESGRERVCKYG